jgi:hypothetical protein
MNKPSPEVARTLSRDPGVANEFMAPTSQNISDARNVEHKRIEQTTSGHDVTDPINLAEIRTNPFADPDDDDPLLDRFGSGRAQWHWEEA